MFIYFVKKLNNMKISIQENGTLTSITVVATFFCLWLAVFFERQVEDVLAYILILTFGILHGANDIALIQRATAPIGTRKGFVIVLLRYLVFVVMSALFFYFLPTWPCSYLFCSAVIILASNIG